MFVFPSSVRKIEDLTDNQMILQSYNDMYISGNVMGFLGVENQRLVIESRFSRGERDYFFQYLLEKVLKFPNFINLQTSINQDDRLFSLMIFLFPIYLREAMRKGFVSFSYIYKYVTSQEVYFSFISSPLMITLSIVIRSQSSKIHFCLAPEYGCHAIQCQKSELLPVLLF